MERDKITKSSDTKREFRVENDVGCEDLHVPVDVTQTGPTLFGPPGLRDE